MIGHRLVTARHRQTFSLAFSLVNRPFSMVGAPGIEPKNALATGTDRYRHEPTKAPHLRGFLLTWGGKVVTTCDRYRHPDWSQIGHRGV